MRDLAEWGPAPAGAHRLAIMLYEESPSPPSDVCKRGADGMSLRGLPHMYSASLYNIGRDCMEIHAASPDVPFNRRGK